MTFDECVALDPKIGDLKREMQAIRNEEGYCADETWYRLFKPRVVDLVGFSRLELGETRHPETKGARSIGQLMKEHLKELTERQRRVELGELHPVWELRSTQAYDAVYRRLYNLLPDCNHAEHDCR